MINFQKIQDRILGGIFGKSAEAKPAQPEVSANLDAILASTDKLLAVNRGHAEPDERDSLEFRRIMPPHQLFAERVRLDADRILKNTMRQVARTRSLKPIGAAHFDSYAEGMIVSHALSSPLEEINPMHLVEQARRITSMGPGGLPNSDSITPESQNLHPSQFGFFSSLEGPESEKIGVDVRLAHGAKLGDDGRLYSEFHDRRRGKKVWLSPVDLVGKTVGLPE